MSDITASERRLIAALDRIDYSIDVSRARQAEAGPDHDGAPHGMRDDDALEAGLEAARLENERLNTDMARLHDRQAEAIAAAHAQLAEASARLTGAGREAARLAAANDDLTAANRALIAAQSGEGEAAAAVRLALEAEIESLRAARAAEIAQMDDVLTALEKLLGTPLRAASASARPADRPEPSLFGPEEA